MRERSSWRAIAAAATLTTPLAVRAQEAPPAGVHVDCPTLTREQRASLEARALAELAMKRLTQGELVIRCEPRSTSAVVEYSAPGGRKRRATTPLPAETHHFADRILPLVDEVTAEPAQGPPPIASFAEEPLAPTAPTRPAVPKAARAPVPARPRGLSHAPSRAPLHARSATPTRRIELLPAFGARAEIAVDLERPSEPLRIGPSASLGVELPLRVRLEAMAALTWSVEATRGIDVRHFMSGLQANAGERLFAGAGAYVSWSHFSADAELSPDSRNLVAPALGLHGGYVLPFGAPAFVLTLGFLARPRYHDVRVNRETAFRTSPLTASLALEYRIAR